MVGGELQDRGELIASEAADGGVRSRSGGEPGAEGGEYGVARRVAQGVVHGLEMVGVDR